MGEGCCNVSVVVPTHNRCSILRENVESVLAQDAADFEVIYVDDDSTDGTGELLESYGERIQVVRGAWHAPGPARNAGARVARGHFLLFTDDDCTVLRGWISGMLARYEQDGCDALSGGFEPYSLDTKTSRYLHNRMRLLFGDESKGVKAVPMMNFLIPRGLFERVGGFREERWEALEDWEFCHRLAANGAKLFYDPAIKVKHRYQTEWGPAMQRLRATAACAVDVYAASEMSVAALMARSTARFLASPAWSLFRYPLDLYSTSVAVEWMTYFERVKAWMRAEVRGADSR